MKNKAKSTTEAEVLAGLDAQEMLKRTDPLYLIALHWPEFAKSMEGYSLPNQSDQEGFKELCRGTHLRLHLAFDGFREALAEGDEVRRAVFMDGAVELLRRLVAVTAWLQSVGRLELVRKDDNGSCR